MSPRTIKVNPQHMSTNRCSTFAQSRLSIDCEQNLERIQDRGHDDGYAQGGGEMCEIGSPLRVDVEACEFAMDSDEVVQSG